MNESEIIARLEALEKQVAELRAELAKLKSGKSKARKKPRDNDSNNTLVKLVTAFRNQEGWGAPLLTPEQLLTWAQGNSVIGFSNISKQQKEVIWNGGSMSWRAFREAFERVIALDEPDLAEQFNALMAVYWRNVPEVGV
ncbi:MAG: hypothetical protein HZT40_22505 [Candidatus Thiothrix singaporensis]|uniref:Uncharacterized protein n=1 Tax=Candidatus Thiothrix singaporensis TaxID=2799669 RepID=A0A7L6AXM7_9GAMM|nr:MAG: hypothetical protein HZT40_22505 [Candidatus Thiothrix singaporensis]